MKNLIIVLALLFAVPAFAQDASTFPTIRDYVDSQKPVMIEVSDSVADLPVEQPSQPERHSSGGGHRKKVVQPTLTDEQFFALIQWILANLK